MKQKTAKNHATIAMLLANQKQEKPQPSISHTPLPIYLAALSSFSHFNQCSWNIKQKTQGKESIPYEALFTSYSHSSVLHYH